MIRTVLASPWTPLLYWTVAVVAVVYDAAHEPMKRRLGSHEFRMVTIASVPTPLPFHKYPSSSQPLSARQAIVVASKPKPFWYPQVCVFRRPASSVQRLLTVLATNKTPPSTQAPTCVNTPTMLSIRVDPAEQTDSKALAIQCRTSVAASNARARTVTIHGVVTQEVVASTGKILIMAGSRVVGSGLLDPENGRVKSNGLWSIFFDDTELKVQAQLLDRPAGLPGLLAQEASDEDEIFQRKAVMRDGHFFFVPGNAPFVLEIHGEILLRDLKSSEASD
jgi:hypothetical protein